MKNKKALAISADVDTVSINPKSIVVKKNGSVDEEKTNELKDKIATAFSTIFELNKEEVLQKLNSVTDYSIFYRYGLYVFSSPMVVALS